MTTIRTADHGDIPEIVALSALMHAESRYAVLPYSTTKIADLGARLIDWPDGFLQVACKGGRIVGLMAGFVIEHFASTARVAGEYALFVESDSRGTRAAIRLLRAYRAWADSRGAVLISAGITTGVHTDVTAKFYESMGACQVGVVFELKG
jgi:GNAT superfamily N-acetyltransferase